MSTLDRCAADQFGLVRWDQAVALVGEREVRRRVRQGQLVRSAFGVYRCAGVPGSFRQRALLPCLSYGPLVAASHATAARLWGVEAVAAEVIDVSVPRHRNGRLPAVRTHRVRLEAADVTDRFGIPLTTPARTLLDLAGCVPPAVLERAIDDLRRLRVLRAYEVRALVRPAAGRDGAGVLRRLVRDRLDGPAPGDSVWVDRVARWIREAGLPEPVRQHQVVVAGRVRILDLAYPEARIAIEYNGWAYHQMRSRVDADHARTTELELAGWLVLVVTSAHRRNTVVSWVRRALEQRSTVF